MSKFTSFSQVTAYNAKGEVLAVATNRPVVDGGEVGMKQQPLMAMIAQLNGYNFSSEIVDIKIEHHPLEGDYNIWCDPKCMTDFGLRYAIAKCYGMIDPLSGTEIVYQDGDLFVVGKPGIDSFFTAFAPFNPWTNKALAWQIAMDFAVSLKFDGHCNVIVIPSRNLDTKVKATQQDVVIRDLLIMALYQRHNKPNTDYNGHVPLSMVQPTLVDRFQAVADAMGDQKVDTAPDSGLAP